MAPACGPELQSFRNPYENVMKPITAFILALALVASAMAHDTPGVAMQTVKKQTQLQRLPKDVPAWINDKTNDEVFYKAGSFNWKIYNVPELALDFNGTGVGHAMAYEDLVRGRKAGLETETFNRIVRVLKNPPKYPVDEKAISPTFSNTYGPLEKVFDWAHLLHFMTIDIMAERNLSDDQKDAKIEEVWKYYQTQAPYVISGLPMNMAYLDSQAYSGTFRKTYPKVNGLFWGYHWLQTAVYDMLYRTPVSSHIPQYDLMGKRYREIELYRTDRDFMPMVAETSPRFAAKFPEIANSFDNLHMLHDMVNDILASDWITPKQKEEQVKLAITMVMASSHKGEKAGTGSEGTFHDHRFPNGMPGMGMMLGADEETMFMPGMGWMNMSECGHCSISLPNGPVWGATMSADGWTMRVRCLLCARDMASQIPGRAIIRAATEDPKTTLVLISDDEGNWKSSLPSPVFLEVTGDHPECSSWSRTFTSQHAFEKFTAANKEFKDAKPLGLVEWAAKTGAKPDTFRRTERPNPYRPTDPATPPPVTNGVPL